VSSCRDGLLERPRKRRNNSSETNGDPSKSSNSRRVEVTDKKVQAKKALDRSNKKLEQLESLHGRSSGSLQLSETGRLRLSADSFQRKPRILPSFDLKLTDLSNSALLDSGIGSNEDEDELPEPLGLVKNDKDLDEKRAISISPETRYSDPELDALIRNLPSENCAQGLQNMSSPRPAADRVVGLSEESPEVSMKTSLPKRHATTIGETPVAKRPRCSSISGEDDSSLTESSGSKNLASPSMASKIFYKQNTCAKQQDDSPEPLFLSSPPQQNANSKVSDTLCEPSFYEGDLDFDLSYFDVLPAPETWSHSTVSLIDESEKQAEIASYTPQRSLSDEASHVCLPREQVSDCLYTNNLGDTEACNGDTELDPFTEFEAWLLQGGVVVVE
jgi:hypothetical protein